MLFVFQISQSSKWKYSKKLSWAWNLNLLFTVIGGKFKFQVQFSQYTVKPRVKRFLIPEKNARVFQKSRSIMLVKPQKIPAFLAKISQNQCKIQLSAWFLVKIRVPQVIQIFYTKNQNNQFKNSDFCKLLKLCAISALQISKKHFATFDFCVKMKLMSTV